MKTYAVKKVNHAFKWNDIEVGKINTYNWDNFKGYDPEAEFQMAHDDNYIYLKMTSHKDYLISYKTEINDIVCCDSCMEAFFNMPGWEGYFNFEFNSDGVLHLGCGNDRYNRIIVAPEIIRRNVTVMVDNDNIPQNQRGKWSFVAIINKAIYKEVIDRDFVAGECGGNFYKCGETAISHFITWNDVGSDHPDFHLVEYFGKLIFE